MFASSVWNVEVTGLNSGYVEIFVRKGQYKFRQVVTNKQHGNWGRVITTFLGDQCKPQERQRTPKQLMEGPRRQGKTKSNLVYMYMHKHTVVYRKVMLRKRVTPNSGKVVT